MNDVQNLYSLTIFYKDLAQVYHLAVKSRSRFKAAYTRQLKHITTQQQVREHFLSIFFFLPVYLTLAVVLV